MTNGHASYTEDTDTSPPGSAYVKDRPGQLVHIDVKHLGRIPEGDGWRAHGRSGHHGSDQGWDKLHIAVDDHSRMAFIQVHPDERGPTCAAFLDDAVSWFFDQGVTVEAVMTDNALNYVRSNDFTAAPDRHRLEHIRTRPFRPQTNGKVERFNRTLVDEFAYARIFISNRARVDALPRWVRYYNTRRRHTALDGHTPHETVNNDCGKNS